MALKIDRVRWIDEGINRNESVTDGFLDLYEEERTKIRKGTHLFRIPEDCVDGPQVEED